VLITAAVIGGLLLYFGYTMFKNQRRHFRMRHQYFLSEMERLEKERNRIAEDMHDELGPILAVTKIQIEKAEEDKSYLRSAAENVKLITERLGHIARNFSHRVLERKGLNTVLEDFFEQCREVTDAELVYSYQISTAPGASISLHIYRMVQELVHNAMKHSKATHIQVLLRERNNKLYLLYKDNGIGISGNNAAKQREGLGLSSLRSRAEMLEGRMTFESTPNKGTEYFFEIPIRRKNETKN
jgi:signal transduction histidine kinase